MAAPERPLAGSRSPALETVRRQAGTTRHRKKREQHELQAAVDGRLPRGRQQAHERGDARMLGVLQRADAADAHQPDEQQPRDLLGPRQRRSGTGGGPRPGGPPRPPARPRAAPWPSRGPCAHSSGRGVIAARRRLSQRSPDRRRASRACVCQSASAAPRKRAAVDVADRHSLLREPLRRGPVLGLDPSRAGGARPRGPRPRASARSSAGSRCQARPPRRRGPARRRCGACAP